MVASVSLVFDPWNLDEMAQASIESHIDQIFQQRVQQAIASGKRTLLIDEMKKIMNFNADACHLCETSERLAKYNFQKVYPDLPKAHCYGISLFLIKYLLAHPDLMCCAAREILSEIENQKDFHEVAHLFSINQHPYYQYGSSKDPIEMQPDIMKKYFKALMGLEPSYYFSASLEKEKIPINRVNIYRFLEMHPNQLIIVGFVDEHGRHHCMVFSTCENKLFIFDANVGLYQFQDIETMSVLAEKVLKECRFRWLACFSKDTTKPPV